MVKKNKAQEYLEQVEKINARIKNKMAEEEQWKSIALSVTGNTEGERVKSSSSQQKMANAVERLVDIRREINKQIEELIAVKQDILRTIEKLNATEYDVLHKRYIQGMTYDEIGATKHKSKSWATTVHGRALQSLNKLLSEKM